MLDQQLDQALRSFPAVSIVGPRASGKTTSAARVAAEVARLDDPAAAAAFVASPDAALRQRRQPVLLDEWHEVPAVLGAVKRAVDAHREAGQFILTGSVTAELDVATWPGTGRMVRLTMATMTQREQRDLVDQRPSLRQILSGAIDLPRERVDVTGYVELAVRGGYPDVAFLNDDRDVRLWLDSYVEQLVNRDAMRIADGRDAARLRRYLQAWALNSAGVVDDTTIYTAAGIDRKTHVAYEALLRQLFVCELVPAWTTNRLKRLVLAPKRYVCDTGLLCAAARIGRDDVLNNGDLLGRLLDSFVFNELRSHALADDERPELFHLRTAAGRHEVDAIVEFDGGRLFAVEIKATAAAGIDDAKHLRWLRDEIGASFQHGVVFHTGPDAFELDDRILALPICALWGTQAR